MSSPDQHPEHKTPVPAGRPRSFAPDAALLRALDVFRRQGYAATSLDDLTEAMQLSRSSFYACFRSKHAVLMAAMQAYADEQFAALTAIAEGESNALSAVRRMLTAIVDPENGTLGCFLVNSVTELAPSDPELAEYSRSHIARVNSLIAQLLGRAGFTRELAEVRAGAALALAMGATTLRKAGLAASHIQALLDQAQTLLMPPGMAAGQPL